MSPFPQACGGAACTQGSSASPQAHEEFWSSVGECGLGALAGVGSVAHDVSQADIANFSRIKVASEQHIGALYVSVQNLHARPQPHWLHRM